MFKIPLLPHFTYRQMKQYPELYTIVTSSGQSESNSVSLIFHLIAQAIYEAPNKMVAVSFDYPQQVDDLNTFLQGKNLSSQRIMKINTYRDLPRNPEHLQQLGGIFIMNHDFFLDDSDFGAMAQQARIMAKFFPATHNILKVMLIIGHQDRELPGDNLWLNRPASFYSQAIVQVSYSRNNTKISIRKNRRGPSNLSFGYKVLNHTWIPLRDYKDYNDFFMFKDPQALVFEDIEERLTDCKNMEEFFSVYQTPKSIKKNILELSLKRQETLDDGLYLLEVTYDYINLYEILKKSFGEELNPDLFNTNIKKRIHSLDSDFVKTHLESIIFLLQKFDQRHVYEWLEKDNQDFFRDSIIMVKELQYTKTSFQLSKEAKTIKEIHDELVDFCAINSPDANKKVQIQKSIKHWDNYKIKIQLDNGTELPLILFVPLSNYEFKTIGKKMGLCIQNSSFPKQLGTNKHNILIMTSESKPEFCIELDKKKRIIQAKARFNQPINEFVLAQLEEIISNLA